jgi:hypothetical protein
MLRPQRETRLQVKTGVSCQRSSHVRSSQRKQLNPTAQSANEGNRMKLERGLSLLQLLIGETIGLFIAGIAVPTFFRSGTATNHALAAGSLRTLPLLRLHSRTRSRTLVLPFWVRCAVGRWHGRSILPPLSPIQLESSVRFARTGGEGTLATGNWLNFFSSTGAVARTVCILGRRIPSGWATIQELALSVNPVALRRINLGCRHMMPSSLWLSGFAAFEITSVSNWNEILVPPVAIGG